MKLAEPGSLVARAEEAVELWAGVVCRESADLRNAEAALGDAVERARRCRRALVKSEQQFENAQRLYRQACAMSQVP